ncbi:MAG: EamA family transporter [Ilumatobacteraceae bacterium]
MSILWALGAAATYGIADYLGGRATRQSPAPAVTFAGQSVALLLLVGLVATSGVSVMSGRDFLWSMGAGFGGALALITFYRAMAIGPMTVVAPITAVVNIAMPVIVGIAQGERPSGLSYLGIGLAPIAVALIGDVLSSKGSIVQSRAIWLSMLAGTGFGLIFVCLAQTSDDAGLWPLLAQRMTSVPTVAVVSLVGYKTLRVNRNVGYFAILSGVLDTLANSMYLTAARAGMLSLVGVITSLYPASTVILAMKIDKERIHRGQVLGILISLASVIAISVGA